MEKQLTIYDTASASLTELESMYANGIVDLSTKDGLKDCTETARKFQKLRTGVEKTRKEANAEANKHIKLVNGEAAKIQDRIEPLESRYAKPLKERKERFKSALAEVDNLPTVCFGKDSAFIGEKLEWLETVKPTDYAEMKKDFEASIFTATDKLTTMMNDAVLQEIEEAERKEKELAQRIDNCINSMKAEIMDCFGKDAFAINQAWKRIYNTIIDDSFGERQEEAEQVRERVLAQLQQMEDMLPKEEPVKEEATITKTVKAKSSAPTAEEVTTNELLEFFDGDIDTVNRLVNAINAGKFTHVRIL